MVKQAHLVWGASNGSPGGITVHHFDDTRTATNIRTTLRGMISAIDGALTSQWTVVEAAEVRVLDTATGQLTGIETLIPQSPVAGTAIGEPVADSTCGLAQYFTGDFVNGRNVRGRTYIPGLSAGALENGQWASAMLSQIADFAAAFAIDPGAVIYRRPRSGMAGSAHAVTGSAAWSQCAVLRHRRQK